MSTHAKLSPSGAYRYLACPGSVREEAKYPGEGSSGPSAVDGTHSHTLLEYCLKTQSDPMLTVGMTMEDHEGSFTVDKERATRVKVATDYVNRISCDVIDDSRAVVFAEMRVNPEHLIGRTDMDGTVDIQIHGKDVLEIIDFKDGMNPVEVKDNPQLELYALGVLASFKLPINPEFYPFKWVRLTIIQPKLAVKGLSPIISHDMHITQVMALIPKYVAGGAATERPDAPLVPGAKQCKYCRASGCSARGQAALTAAGVSFPSLLPAVSAPSTQVAEQDPGTMTNDRLTEILEAAPLMRQMIEQAEAEAQRRLESGISIPGLKLVNGRGSQVWNLDEEKIAEKLKGMGVPKDAIWVTKLVSPAQAKKSVTRDWWKIPLDNVRVSLAHSKIPKKKIPEVIEGGPSTLASIEWVNRKGENCRLSPAQIALLTRDLVATQDVLLTQLETEYISKLGGKLTVAPASDPRPAVVRDAAPLFSAVQPEQAPALPSWLS